MMGIYIVSQSSTCFFITEKKKNMAQQQKRILIKVNQETGENGTVEIGYLVATYSLSN